MVVNGQPIFDDMERVQQYVCTAYTGPRCSCCSDAVFRCSLHRDVPVVGKVPLEQFSVEVVVLLELGLPEAAPLSALLEVLRPIPLGVRVIGYCVLFFSHVTWGVRVASSFGCSCMEGHN